MLRFVYVLALSVVFSGCAVAPPYAPYGYGDPANGPGYYAPGPSIGIGVGGGSFGGGVGAGVGVGF
jgi:hypothetical protein